MKHIGIAAIVGTAALVAAWALAPPDAGAVACPGSGAIINVCVTNPTSTQTPPITLSGGLISGQNTCYTGSILSAYSLANVTVAAGTSHCFPAPSSSGLVTGMYVHRINVPSTGQSQYQKVPVVYSTGTLATVSWTYYPNVVTVNTAGDAGTGTCTTNCTLRQAIATANNLSGGYSSPVLIQFTVSPGYMTQGADLELAGAGNITIDGTDSNGNPWIVGDANAAAAGSQDPFPRVVDLSGVTRFKVSSSSNAIRGLDIRNTLAVGNQQKHLFFQPTQLAGTTLEAVRMDGGNREGNCLVGGFCNEIFDAIYVGQGNGAATNLLAKNVEVHSAINQGIQLSSNAVGVVEESWIHNNYKGNITASSATAVTGESTIERAGLRVTDDLQVDYYASGVVTTNGTIESEGDVVRNNVKYGMEATDISNLLPFDVNSCGNGDAGVVSLGDCSGEFGTAPSVHAAGLAATYNQGNGVRLDDSLSAILEPDCAFASNALCGFKSNAACPTAYARNDQWRSISGSYVDVCAGSNVVIDPVQNYTDGPISVNSSQPTFPSNVMLNGQTVRVEGSGFNAIDGNPLPDVAGCATGIDGSGHSVGQPGSCCKQPAKANTCGSGTHNPLSGRGNCVELRNAGGTWRPVSVTSLTPSSAVAQIPDSVFGCVGGSGEKVSVSKRTRGGVVLVDHQKDYCTNLSPF